MKRKIKWPTKLEMKRVEKNQCSKCSTPLIPDKKAVIFGTKKWDGHCYKFNCECCPNKDVRICIG